MVVGLLVALLSTAAAPRTRARPALDLHHAAGTGAEPVTDQHHAVAGLPDRGDTGPGGAADLHPRRQVQHGGAGPPGRADGAADHRRQPRPGPVGCGRGQAARRERRSRGVRLRDARDGLRVLLLDVGKLDDEARNQYTDQIVGNLTRDETALLQSETRLQSQSRPSSRRRRRRPSRRRHRRSRWRRPTSRRPRRRSRP